MVSAYYGADSLWWDVSQQVKSLPQSGQQYIIPSNHLFGGDPAPGRVKSLVVKMSDGSEYVSREGAYWMYSPYLYPYHPASTGIRTQGETEAAQQAVVDNHHLDALRKQLTDKRTSLALAINRYRDRSNSMSVDRSQVDKERPEEWPGLRQNKIDSSLQDLKSKAAEIKEILDQLN